ncbi:TonB-dependent receptor [Sphingomonas quercus]|uniref:TonB-dependent receptor n=1 Tax=Sphingomonas quercus TaxID=2842451 RepID=A0ABS6BID8_9SPHN|nr:TonB-dependent receptor [Sphingomonas quercus]MBU3078073.1 TonB-dependent receptor [Sphingomonas quercus]
MNARRRHGFFFSAGLTAIAVALTTPTAASAQDGSAFFDIPAQDLGIALRAFGKSARQPIAFNGDLTRGKKSHAIKGAYAPPAALRLLLAQSGLTFRSGDHRVIFVEAQAQSAAGPTPAPEPAPPAAEPEPEPAPSSAPVMGANPGDGEIIVTGSRIAIAGYKQPTPVTVVNEAVLQRDARSTIGDSIRQLPAVGSSASPSGANNNIVAGNTGLDTVNLRQLGVTRTLVLFDGQRVVQSNVTGQIDMGTLPTALVQRIDVVTAGASAAWGSDAVSGVVNLIINKSFDGLRGSAEYNDTYQFDRQTYRLQFAAGTGFAEGRGRVIVAGNYFESVNGVFANERSWNTYRNLVNNTPAAIAAGGPRLIHADNAGMAGATTGGLIVGACRVAITAGGCPAGQGVANFNLLNQQFKGSSATLAPYNITNVSGTIAANTDTLPGATNNIAVQYNTTSLFGYTSYEFADWLKASVQLNYGRTFSRNNSVPYVRIGATGAVPIRIDNPYLPASVVAAMTAAGVQTIQIGTNNITNIDADSLSYKSQRENSIGMPVATTTRKLKRGVFSLEGRLGGDWSWNAYFQRGEVELYQTTESNNIIPNYNKAVDAVRNAAGAIVCRVNADAITTNDDAACRPLNIIGEGNASQEAIRYVNVKPGQNFQRQKLTENVVAASMQGSLPFGFAAGNIAVAFGAERRTEKGAITNDAGAQARNVYPVANFPSFFGKYNVEEAFVELDVPIIEDGFVRSLSFNTAGRVTWYSTSGQVETWKVGLLSQLNNDLRVRATLSRDIRAPNLNELYSTGLQTQSTAVDPKTNQSVLIFTFGSGNPNLTPERATTLSGGIVLSPSWLPRFNISLDYYDIKLKDVIASINAQEVLRRCNAGDAQFCPQLVFNGPGGALSQINTFPQNLAAQRTSGLDFQTDYTFPALGGDVQVRVLGNYVLRLNQDQLGVQVKAAGAIGSDQPFTGFPRARVTASATWDKDKLSLTAQTRFIGAAKLVYTWKSGVDVDDNSVPAIAYIDLRGSYQLTRNVQLFGTVDNLLNQDPPNVAGGPTNGLIYTSTPTSSTLYDLLGRQYRIGVRFKF